MIAAAVRLPAAGGAAVRANRISSEIERVARSQPFADPIGRQVFGQMQQLYNELRSNPTPTDQQRRAFEAAAVAVFARAQQLGSAIDAARARRLLNSLSLELRASAHLPGAPALSVSIPSAGPSTFVLPPSPSTPLPSPGAKAGRPGRTPRKPRKPREPRDARTSRPPRARRAPRRPRRPRPAREQRAPRAPRRRQPRPEADSGWRDYCAIHDQTKWRGLPPSCHRLHISQANAVRLGGGELVETDKCAGCQGTGCDGPLAPVLAQLLRPFVDSASRNQATRERAAEAVERRARRRRPRIAGAIDDAARRAGPSPAPGQPPAPGYGWYLCRNPTGPLAGLAARCVWIHSSQAAAANRGGADCQGPLGHDAAVRPC